MYIFYRCIWEEGKKINNSKKIIIAVGVLWATTHVQLSWMLVEFVMSSSVLKFR